MIPQTDAGTRTPARQGGEARGLPETGHAAIRPIAIAAHGIYVTDIDIDGARAWTVEREKNKLARATRIRQAWGSSDPPSK